MEFQQLYEQKIQSVVRIITSSTNEQGKFNQNIDYNKKSLQIQNEEFQFDQILNKKQFLNFLQQFISQTNQLYKMQKSQNLIVLIIQNQQLIQQIFNEINDTVKNYDKSLQYNNNQFQFYQIRDNEIFDIIPLKSNIILNINQIQNLDENYHTIITFTISSQNFFLAQFANGTLQFELDLIISILNQWQNNMRIQECCKSKLGLIIQDVLQFQECRVLFITSIYEFDSNKSLSALQLSQQLKRKNEQYNKDQNKIIQYYKTQLNQQQKLNNFIENQKKSISYKIDYLLEQNQSLLQQLSKNDQVNQVLKYGRYIHSSKFIKKLNQLNNDVKQIKQKDQNDIEKIDFELVPINIELENIQKQDQNQIIEIESSYDDGESCCNIQDGLNYEQKLTKKIKKQVQFNIKMNSKRDETKQKIKRDKDHIIQKLISAFRAYLLDENNSTEIMMHIKSSDIIIFLNKWNLFFQNILFNKTLIKQLLLHSEFGDIFSFFLQNKARKWFDSSKYADNIYLQQAISNYSLASQNKFNINQILQRKINDKGIERKK